MARSSKLVIAALLSLLGASARAGYAQLAPPPGWSAGTGAGATYAAAANDVWSTAGTVRTNAALSVGGRTVIMPAAMRLAANAPRIAAAAIFLNPYVRTAVGIAAWLGLGNLIWDSVNNRWGRLDPNSGGITDGYTYSVRSIRSYNLHHGVTPSEACNKAASSDSLGFGVPVAGVAVGLICQISVNGQTPPNSYEIAKSPNPVTCTAGMFVDANGVCHNTPQTSPVTQKEFEDALEPKPMPSTVPNELPKPTPLPVDLPIINPSPALQPQPLTVPTGEPVPNPNYNPSAPTSPANSPYQQPVVKVVPSPTASEPWRVDLQPENIPLTGPEPLPEPEVNPNPETDSNKPPQEDTESLCEKHPDIAACAKLDEVEPEDVQNEQKNLSITPSAGWETGAGTCPAPVTRQVAGLTLEMQWQPFCDLATGIRPVILALAWVAAAMMVIGVARRGE